MVAPSARGDAPQQNASRVNEIFTFEGTEQLPPSESTRRKKRLRDRGSLGDGVIGTPETTSNKENHGRVTTQELRRLIEDLKEVITNQSNVIQEIKANQQAIKSQNVELQKQIHALQEQLEAVPATKTGTKTWAEIAAAASQQDPTVRIKQPRKELNCVRISTQRTPDNGDDENGGFRRYLPTDMANAKIRSALLSSDTTKDTQVAGVGTTKTGYVIRFRDAQSAETARSNTAWLEELGNETKLVKPRFGIVVHRVPTEDFDLDNDKKHGIQKMLEENNLTGKGFEIEDVAWLKKKDRPLGRSASMGIWLNTPEAAESIINNGLLVGQRYIGSVEPYRVELKRCNRCQRFGHLAWSCREQVKCGHCSGQHEQRYCPPGVRPRCSDCNGEYPTGDRRCQTPLNPSSSQ
jgi:FtsZ-binding cell division protein ZapB